MESNKNVRFSSANSFEISKHIKYIDDYEDEWDSKQELRDHLAKIENLKSKLQSINIPIDIRAEQRQKEERMRIDEAQQIIIKQLEYMRNRRIVAEVEKAKIAEEYKRLEEESLKREREKELRAEFTRKLRQEAYVLRCSQAITKPYVFSYYYEKGDKRPLTEKKSKRK